MKKENLIKAFDVAVLGLGLYSLVTGGYTAFSNFPSSGDSKKAEACITEVEKGNSCSEDFARALKNKFYGQKGTGDMLLGLVVTASMLACLNKKSPKPSV